MRTMDEDKARRGQGQGQDDAVAGAGMECWNMPLYLTLVLDYVGYCRRKYYVLANHGKKFPIFVVGRDG